MTEVKDFTQKSTPVPSDLMTGMQAAKGVGDERLFSLEDIDAASGLTFINNYTPLGNGFTIETVDTVVSSDGLNISILVQKLGGGNFSIILNEGVFAFTATSINLTAGTDTVPQFNYVYIIDNAGTATLTVSTSGWPTSVDYAAIATVFVQSIGTVQTDLALKVHQWTDHMGNGEPNGHLAHINSWIRHQHAHWMSGAAGSISITPNGGAKDNVFFANTAGMVHQLHMHDFPVRDMSLGDDIYVANGDGSTIVDYEQFADLNGILTDSNNVSLSGRYFNLVIWGVVSEDAADCKIFVNLPTSSYNSSANALADADKTSVFTFPSAFIGTAFMIGRVTLRHQTAASGTWTEVGYESLLGQNPNNIAGTGQAGVTDHGGLSGLLDDDHTIYLLADGSRVLVDTLKITEQAAAAADVAGNGQLWVKNTTPNELWFTNDAGTDIQLGVASTAASETSAGIAELATQAEAETGTDDLRIMTPLGVQQKLDNGALSVTFDRIIGADFDDTAHRELTAAEVMAILSGAALNMADALLTRPVIKDYGRAVAVDATATGTVVVDHEDGNVHHLTLTGNITTLTLSNVPASGANVLLFLEQGGSGSYTVAWGAVDWGTEGAPTLDTAVGKMNIVTLTTLGGVVFGVHGGGGFTP